MPSSQRCHRGREFGLKPSAVDHWLGELACEFYLGLLLASFVFPPTRFRRAFQFKRLRQPWGKMTTAKTTRAPPTGRIASMTTRDSTLTLIVANAASTAHLSTESCPLHRPPHIQHPLLLLGRKLARINWRGPRSTSRAATRCFGNCSKIWTQRKRIEVSGTRPGARRGVALLSSTSWYRRRKVSHLSPSSSRMPTRRPFRAWALAPVLLVPDSRLFHRRPSHGGAHVRIRQRTFDGRGFEIAVAPRRGPSDSGRWWARRPGLPGKLGHAKSLQ